MLNVSVGSTTIVDGVPAIEVPCGRRGHALFGPYETLDPGLYTVEFAIERIGSEDIEDSVCAIVDVVADHGKRDIAFAAVLPSAIVEVRSIRLDFDLNARTELEYRVHVNGTAALRVLDRAIVTLRAGHEPAAFEAIPHSIRRFIKHLYENNVAAVVEARRVTVPTEQLVMLAESALSFDLRQDRQSLAHMVVKAVGYRGDDENSLYRAFVGAELPMVSPPKPVPFTSTLCQQVHFGYDQYRFWTSALKETPKFQRKQWEFVYIAQALFERGLLEPGRRGLVFGAGQEQLPALFASFGVKILATDQAPEAAVQGGWIESGQHTYDIDALNQRGICTNRMFQELVSYRSADMNDIPNDLAGQFDFCWSACAFEHLGSIQKGLDFVANSLGTLRPGGIAVHTTEYNLSSNDDTIETENLSLYRRRDIDGLVAYLSAQGFEVAPIDWSQGEGFAEMVVDLPPYAGRGEPHIRLKAGQYDTTSIGLIVRRPT